jgi:hypothetical protein
VSATTAINKEKANARAAIICFKGACNEVSAIWLLPTVKNGPALNIFWTHAKVAGFEVQVRILPV